MATKSSVPTTVGSQPSSLVTDDDNKKAVIYCHGCRHGFPSRNAVFAHLKTTAGACLSDDARADFLARVGVPDERVILLYGYRLDASGDGSRSILPTGDAAAEFLLDTCLQVSKTKKNDTTTTSQRPKYLRSYGNLARKSSSDMVAQDKASAGSLTEVVATKLPILASSSVDEWIQLVNMALSENFQFKIQQRAQTETATPLRHPIEPRIVLFGRRELPGKIFNAEMDVTHRKIDYVLPAQLLGIPKEKLKDLLPPFRKQSNNGTETDMHIVDPTHPNERNEPMQLPQTTLEYMQSLKRSMQQFTTHAVPLDPQDAIAVQTKQDHIRKRQRNRSKESSKSHGETRTSTKIPDKTSTSNNHGNNNDENKTPSSVPDVYVLKRKTFHNFTSKVMAHEYLSNRRLDRFFHKFTLHTDKNVYLLLSLTGDMFLKGQVCRVIGAWLGLQRGLIDTDIVECLFDSDYPSLVPTPPVPPLGMYAQSAQYLGWEGKAQAILTPRKSDRYPTGWKDINLLKTVHEYGNELRQSIVQEWEENEGICDSWVRDVLEPWATQANKHLERYRLWKISRTDFEENGASPESSQTVQARVNEPISPPSVVGNPGKPTPEIFRAVLYHLRLVYETGQWPETSNKRQVVMVTDNPTIDKATVTNSSATNRTGGSFSVGYMPRWQPKANKLFPKLVKAAFALEQVLLPDREPSSTIAVNRNAQFRP